MAIIAERPAERGACLAGTLAGFAAAAGQPGVAAGAAVATQDLARAEDTMASRASSITIHGPQEEEGEASEAVRLWKAIKAGGGVLPPP